MMMKKDVLRNVIQRMMLSWRVPFRRLAREYVNTTVVIVATTTERACILGKGYGWSTIFPFKNTLPVNHSFGLVQIIQQQQTALPPIAAIVFFDTPNDWERSLQLLIDITRSPTGVPGSDGPQSISIHVANPDFSYATLAPFPRLKLGAFILCFKACFERSTGRALDFVTEYGKPHAPIYVDALASLQAQSALLQVELQEIYVIGDNPVSDIAGARAQGFKSILVRTGIFGRNTKEENDTAFPADKVCDDLYKAVNWIYYNTELKMKTTNQKVSLINECCHPFLFHFCFYFLITHRQK